MACRKFLLQAYSLFVTGKTKDIAKLSTPCGGGIGMIAHIERGIIVNKRALLQRGPVLFVKIDRDDQRWIRDSSNWNRHVQRETLDMVVRYTRSVKFEDSLQLYQVAMKG
jgi:hypothetical protein